MPRGSAVRPTADRVREAMFARLGALDGARVLDLFAGSGSLGIEALSRGAATAVFVERAGAVVAILRENLLALGLEAASRVVRADVAAAIRRLAAAAACFDLVLLDPPYADAEACEKALRSLATSGILAPGATVLVEASRRMPPPETAGLRRLDERRYGDTVLHRFEAEGARDGDPAGGEDERST